MDVFGALADPVRRSLLGELAAGPSRVVDLAARRPISRPAVSKHLRLLAEAGLVEAAEQGRERHYSLRPQALAPVQRLVADLMRRQAEIPDLAAALDALDTEVRRTERERRTRDAESDRPDEGREESA